MLGCATNPAQSAPFNTAGTGLTGSGATVSLSTPVTVANGGQGNATLAAHGVLIGNGTSAVNVTGTGTSGQVLTSNGASADPTFQAASGGSSGGWEPFGYQSGTQAIAVGGANKLHLLCFASSGSLSISHIAVYVATADATTTNYYDACFYNSSGALIADWANNAGGGASHGVALNNGGSCGTLPGVCNLSVTTGTMSGNVCIGLTGMAVTAVVNQLASSGAQIYENTTQATTSNGLCPTSAGSITFAPNLNGAVIPQVVGF